MWQYNYSNDLYHHGVRGMKWGVRRYQNPDGTLTSAGRKRYQIHRGDSEFTKFVKRTRKKMDTAKLQRMEKRKAEKEEKTKAKEAAKEAEKKANKPISELSDAELRSRVERMRMEREVLTLKSDIERMSPQKKEKGKGFVKHFAENAVKPALTDAGKDLLGKYLKKTGAKMMGLNEDTVDDGMKTLKDMAEKAKLKQTIATSEMTQRKNRQQQAEEDAANKAAKEAKKAAKNLVQSNASNPISSISTKSRSSGEEFVSKQWENYIDDYGE